MQCWTVGVHAEPQKEHRSDRRVVGSIRSPKAGHDPQAAQKIPFTTHRTEIVLVFWEVGEELLLEAVRDQLSHEPEQVRRNTDMMGLAANRFLLSSIEAARSDPTSILPRARISPSRPAAPPAAPSVSET